MENGRPPSPKDDTPVRTASISRHLPLHNPTPDLQSLQGAYLKNVQALEDSAERISLGSSMEEELKKMRQSEKASKVLIVINKNLSRLLQTLEKVRGSRTVVQSNQIEWNITVRKYTTALSLLGKCIGKHYFRENLKEDPHEYKQAREILVAMIQEIKRVKDSNDIPESVRNEVLKLKTMASKASDVKKFINQETDPKAAMIERKENDAK